MADTKYHINEFGEIVRDAPTAPKTADDAAADKMNREYDALHYEIFSHPDRHSPDELAKMRARYDELSKQLGLNNQVSALQAGRAKLKQMMAAGKAKTQANVLEIINRAKEND